MWSYIGLLSLLSSKFCTSLCLADFETQSVLDRGITRAHGSEAGKVPGHNPFYFCGKDNQDLFYIFNLDVKPYDPVPLDDWVYAHMNANALDIEGLEDARFRTSATFDRETKSFELPLSEFPNFSVRHHGEYQSRLRVGMQELVGDYLFYRDGLPRGDWLFRAQAFLPDGRNLFCIEFSQYLDGTG